MISIAHRYTDFGPIGSAGIAPEPIQNDALEGQRLRQFEAGYQAGWDDATASLKGEQAHISAEFAQSLQDMSFGFVEASAKLTSALEPLMQQIFANLLPEVARQALPAHAFEQITALIGPDTTQKVDILTAPENANALQAILDDQLDLPFRVQSDANLGPTQVFLRVDESERQINFDEVLKTMSDAIDAFFQQTPKGIMNG